MPAAKRRSVSSIVTVHLWVGALVVALAILAVWRRPGRRVTLYVLTLQIIIGIVLAVQGARISPLHVVLAGLGWAGYMAANVYARRYPERRIGLTIAVVSSLLILAAFGIGERIAHGAG
jgi:hypothetical protein